MYLPRLESDGVPGVRCPRCGFATAPATPRCPACAAEPFAVTFAPTGTVWAATVVHIAVGDRPPPFGVAYVDLDDGPRVLTHVRDALLLEAGTRVRLRGGADDAWAVAAPVDAG